jgi:hypothetical protein
MQKDRGRSLASLTTTFHQYRVFYRQNQILSRASSTKPLSEKCIVAWVGGQPFDIVVLLCMISWDSEDEVMTWREYARQDSVKFRLGHSKFVESDIDDAGGTAKSYLNHLKME